MKNLVVFLSCFVFASVYSQEIRINSYGSYMFDDKMSIDDNKGTLYGNFLYGGGVEYVIASKIGVEFIYKRLASDFQYKYQSDNYRYPYSLNNFMLGFNHYFHTSRIEPFYGLDLGVASLNIKNNGLDPYIKFAWGAKAGVNFSLTPTAAIRLQGGFTSIVESFSTDLYFDIHGVHPSVNTNSHIYQFYLGGGLIFKIPHTTKRKTTL